MGSVIFKRPPLKKLKKEGLSGVDMHFHTKYSADAISRISTAVKKAQKKGFSFAITDHNTISGVMAAHRMKKSALIVPGIEITCSNGNHLLAYFYSAGDIEAFFKKRLKPRMNDHKFFVDVSPLDLVQMSKEYNYLLCAAHPFGFGVTGVMHSGMTKRLEKGLKMVEVINGYNFRRANLKAVYWASSLGKGMTGGSDGHSSHELGKVLTFTHGEDIESIFREILKEKSIVIGKEDNFFLKAVMGISKESAYVKRSKKNKMAKQLLRSQLGPEYRYLKEKFKNRRSYRMLAHNHKEIQEGKLKDDAGR